MSEGDDLTLEGSAEAAVAGDPRTAALPAPTGTPAQPGTTAGGGR